MLVMKWCKICVPHSANKGVAPDDTPVQRVAKDHVDVKTEPLTAKGKAVKAPKAPKVPKAPKEPKVLKVKKEKVTKP